MEIKRNIKVPTGNILIVDGEHGLLECLSLGDYGKEKNVKADFLGLCSDINGVAHTGLMPLEEKWVVTISTQYGCSMGCKFCDVPKVGPGKNATLNDLTNQVLSSIKLHPEVLATKRLNVHYARMGEPTFNRNVLEHAMILRKSVRPYIGRSMVHPVVSTMLPNKNTNLIPFLQDWCEIKNDVYKGDAGLQFSINTTHDAQRDYLFNGNSLYIHDISIIGDSLPRPVSRKYCLNIALSDTSIVEAEVLAKLFDPEKFMVKITPMHKTNSCVENAMDIGLGYSEYTPYKEIENEIKAAGFDVLVFIPSLEEDLGRITCGNAILSGSSPECEYEEGI